MLLSKDEDKRKNETVENRNDETQKKNLKLKKELDGESALLTVPKRLILQRQKTGQIFCSW